MGTTTKIIIGILIITIFATATYILLPGQVKFRVDNDKSTIYTYNENNRFEVSGREFNKLFQGISKLNRRATQITRETIIDNITNTTTIIRRTPYIRGPVIIDTWFFDGKVTDKEKFPISHKIEIINGTGMIYQYEVREVEWDGDTTKLDTNYFNFGKNIKVTWDGRYYWAKVYKSDILKVRYRINSDRVVLNNRLFDPVVDVEIVDLYGISYSDRHIIFGGCYGKDYARSDALPVLKINRSPSDIETINPISSIFNHTVLTKGTYDVILDCDDLNAKTDTTQFESK